MEECIIRQDKDLFGREVLMRPGRIRNWNFKKKLKENKACVARARKAARRGTGPVAIKFGRDDVEEEEEEEEESEQEV